MVRRLNGVFRFCLRLARRPPATVASDGQPRGSQVAVGEINFGSLRRLTPISSAWGYDRGLPIDRYYIERFLHGHSSDIRGHVLEIGDNTYTRRFGGDHVTRSDVLNLYDGPGTTIQADLASAPHIRSDTFDCIIFTQTLQLIYDIHSAVATLHRILRPGGVLLATFPGITNTEDGQWGRHWCWSLTASAGQRLFGDAFSPEAVHVDGFGNVLTAISFLHGVAAEELTPEELDFRQPAFDVTIAVRASKRRDAPVSTPSRYEETGKVHVGGLVRQETPIDRRSSRGEGSGRVKLTRWEGLRLLYRDSPADGTDRAELEWMKGGWLWKKFADAMEREHLGLIVDIGGHIGSFGVPAVVEGFGRGAVTRLVALEPEEESHSLFVANLHLNGMGAHAEVVRMGIAGSDGESVLQISREGWGHSTQVTRVSHLNPMTGEVRIVPTCGLGTLLQQLRLGPEEDVGFMKLNAEGAEFEFVRHARDRDLRRIRHMVAELHFDLVEGASLESFLGVWQRAGFRTEVEPGGGPLRAMVAAHRVGPTTSAQLPPPEEAPRTGSGP